MHLPAALPVFGDPTLRRTIVNNLRNNLFVANQETKWSNQHNATISAPKRRRIEDEKRELVQAEEQSEDISLLSSHPLWVAVFGFIDLLSSCDYELVESAWSCSAATIIHTLAVYATMVASHTESKEWLAVGEQLSKLLAQSVEEVRVVYRCFVVFCCPSCIDLVNVHSSICREMLMTKSAKLCWGHSLAFWEQMQTVSYFCTCYMNCFGCHCWFSLTKIFHIFHT